MAQALLRHILIVRHPPQGDVQQEEEPLNAEGQSDFIAFLTAPVSYGLAGPVEVIETHISRIFLVGDRAFKTKRAVGLPYVDFSTADLRLAACRREVELNNATAPGIYRRVRRITRQADGGLAFDGDGPLVDAAIEMRRFDQTALFDRMAGPGRLTPALMTKTARMIADFHHHAPIAHTDGGAEMRTALSCCPSSWQSALRCVRTSPPLRHTKAAIPRAF